MSISYENVTIQPLISITSPRETTVETVFFPSMRKATKKRSAGSTEELLRDVMDDTVDTVSRSVHSLKTAVFLSRVKPNNRQIDPGHFYMDHFVSNKENRDYCDRKHVTGITTHKLPARQNTAHVLQHVSIISGNMSGSKTQTMKGRETGSLRGKSQSGKQSFSSVRTSARDKKSGVTLKPDKVNTTVHDLRTAKLTPKETLPRHSVNDKEVSKSVKPEEKKSRPNSFPHVDQSLNQALLHITEKGSREGARTRRLSPRSLLDQISEESSTKTPRRGMSHSGTKPKGLGTKVSTPVDRTKSPSKTVSPNVSSARMKKNDKSRGAAGLEDKVQEMALPKVTINEVLQSWNIGPQRTRSTSLAGKDPLEFLRRDRSLSDPKNRPTSYEDLRSCRYLRTDKDDQHLHGRICSCNSCEHGEGLRNTPYLNS